MEEKRLIRELQDTDMNRDKVRIFFRDTKGREAEYNGMVNSVDLEKKRIKLIYASRDNDGKIYPLAVQIPFDQIDHYTNLTKPPLYMV